MRGSKISRPTVSLINQISRLSGIVSLIFLLAMMLLTVSDVFLRYIFNKPIAGSLELTEYFMVVAGFMGIAWCALKRGHVKVDLVLNHLPPRFQKIADCLTLIFAMTVVPLVGWRGFVQARLAHQDNVASDFLNIPAYPFYMVVGLSYALLFMVLVTLLAELMTRSTKK